MNCKIFIYFQERRHQEDLKLLRQRLNLLEDNQVQQLDEFHEIAHSTLRNTFLEGDETQLEVKHEHNISTEKIDIEKATSPTNVS